MAIGVSMDAKSADIYSTKQPSRVSTSLARKKRKHDVKEKKKRRRRKKK
jgi:hypothetical protein